MQVARPELQHQVMIEAVENHMPEVIVIDEIGTELEAQAARTIAERGVMLVATAHGNALANLIKNPTLSDLVGGIQSVTLGDDEPDVAAVRKRFWNGPPSPRSQWRWRCTAATAGLFMRMSRTVDLLLRGQTPRPQQRELPAMVQVQLIDPTLRSVHAARRRASDRGWFPCPIQGFSGRPARRTG